MSDKPDIDKEKLLELIHEAFELDVELRKKYNIGDKFRFIRDRLIAIKKHIETELASLQQKEKVEESILGENDVLIYVALYNAQGNVLTSWQKSLNPSVFYEYSVNRPIYSEKKFIEDNIRSKLNKLQHAYITVCVNKNDILPPSAEGALKDLLGHPLIRVREGSLDFKKMRTFTHNGIDYQLDSNGELTHKEMT